MDTPPFSHLVIECMTYCLCIPLLRHARSQGLRWVSTLLWGMVFGTVIELLLVNSPDSSYSYGRFLVMLGPPTKDVPLCVGIGWGEILYVASWTAQRLHQPVFLRPVTAGVLAVNIDLSLDPIAELLYFWHWGSPATVNFYGVPFDNFLGWFAIVGGYSAFVRALFRRFKPGRIWVDLTIPALGAALAVLLLFALQPVLDRVYAVVGELVPFLIVFGLATVATWHAVFRSRRDLAPAYAVLAIPLCFHVLLMLLFLFSDGPSVTGFASLVALIPQNLAVGFFGFAWVSLDKLFPSSAQATARSAAALAASESER